MAFDFSDLMKDRAEGQVVVPMLKTYLHNAEFPDDFAVHFRKGDQNRPADGWFWPSTHPTLCPGYLYTYLTDPDSLPVEDKEFMNVLALTMGSAVHGFIEMCLRNLGLRTPELNACTMCPPEKNCSEPGFKDDKTGSRGHTDGVLDISSLKPPSHIPDITAFELKTMNSRGIRFLENMDLDRWREKHPVYYAQNQEYMRLSGLRFTIVVVMELGWPWTMREIHVPYDDAAANITRDKYLAVRQAAKDKTPLECCGKSTCPLSAYQKKVKTTSAGGSYLMPAPTRRTA